MDSGGRSELREITVPGILLDERGELAQAGWARQPYLDCNLENARSVSLRPLRALRLKRWDYYAVATPAHFFSVTLATSDMWVPSSCTSWTSRQTSCLRRPCWS